MGGESQENDLKINLYLILLDILSLNEYINQPKNNYLLFLAKNDNLDGVVRFVIVNNYNQGPFLCRVLDNNLLKKLEEDISI